MITPSLKVLPAAVVAIMIGWPLGPGARACSVAEATGRAQIQRLEQAASAARQVAPILSEMEKLNNKARDPKRPVGEQLSQRDRSTFNELSGRLRFINSLELMESNRERDVKILEQIWQQARRMYQGHPAPLENSAEYNYYGILAMIIVATGNRDVDVPRMVGSTCDLGNALAVELAEVNSEMNRVQPEVRRALQWVDDTRRKYRDMARIDPSRLSASDRRQYDSLERQIILPARRTVDYAKALYAIREVDRISSERFIASRDRFVQSGGDVRQVDSAFIDPPSSMDEPFLNIITIIRGLFPSDVAIQLRAVPNAAGR